MPDPIRILHVFRKMMRGGAEMRTMELFRRLNHGGYEWHFCALGGEAGEFDDEIGALGGCVHHLGIGRLDFAGRFSRLLEERRFDVVHSHVHYPSGLLLRAAARQGVPVRIAHFRTTNDGRGTGLLRRTMRAWMRRWIDRYATHILAVSQQAMALSWGPRWKSDPRCRVIYNGLETAPFAGPADRGGVLREFGLPADTFLCCHVGKFKKAKNHGRLVEIFARTLRLRPAARLLLAGAPEERSIVGDVRRRIVRLGIGGEVVFCGERGDVPRLLRAADVLILPSLWEGLPGVVLEAAAAGTPVVASDLASIAEIAAKLPLVRRVPLEAEDDAWARSIAGVPPSAAEARTLAAQAFAQSEFTIERCAKAISSIWRQSARAAAA